MSPRALDSFTEFVIDQLRGLGVIEARRLFGGQGLYWKEQIFGLIHEGSVFFRVSAVTALRYQAEGSKPFEPRPGQVMKGYYEVPSSVLEDADEAVVWAREARSLPRGKERKSAPRSPEGRQTRKRKAPPRK